MRRDKNDLEWQALKKRVFTRDHNTCRLLAVLTPQEFYVLRRNAGPGLSKIDPAHIFPVGAHPEFIYNDKDVICLNRFSHDCLDNCRNPLTGTRITRSERDDWWKRIIGEKLYLELETESFNKSE